MKGSMKRWSLPLVTAAIVWAAPVMAQQPDGCKGCGEGVERVEYEEALRRERQRVRLQLAQVRAQLAAPNLDVHVEKALREAESKIRNYDRELVLRLAYARGPARGVRVEQIMRPADGYLGVTYSGAQIVVSTRDGLVAHHSGYPVIESVEPGSPAYRAGLEAGDTVIAYNGDDLIRHDVVLSKLLKPGSRVRVKVRRAGTVREVEVLITRRPQALATDVFRVRVAPRQPGAVGGRMTSSASSRTVTGTQGVTPAPAPVSPAPTAAAAPVIWGPSTTSAVAGAEIVRLNAALGETFGVKAGVLVLNVGSGTPAERAGLRGGDVIVAAGGTPVTAPQALSLAVRRATDRQVSLEVVRKARKQTVVLRWCAADGAPGPLPGRPRRSDDDDLHAAIPGTALRRAIVGDRAGLAVPRHVDPGRVDAFGDQRRAHRLRAPFRQSLVGKLGPDGVGVPLDGDTALAILAEDGCDRSDLGARARRQVRLSAGEKSLPEHDREPSLRFPDLGDIRDQSVEVEQRLVAQALRFGGASFGRPRGGLELRGALAGSRSIGLGRHAGRGFGAPGRVRGIRLTTEALDLGAAQLLAGRLLEPAPLGLRLTSGLLAAKPVLLGLTSRLLTPEPILLDLALALGREPVGLALAADARKLVGARTFPLLREALGFRCPLGEEARFRVPR